MKHKIIVMNNYWHYGGPMVLSELSKTLKELGYDTEVLMVPYFPNKETKRVRFYYDVIKLNLEAIIKTTICNIFKESKFTDTPRFYLFKNILVPNVKFKRTPFLRKGTIVIYAEGVYGNPLDADYVVRWLLSYYKKKNEQGAYSMNDLFIAFREQFNDAELNPNHYTITINSFNHFLYHQYNFNPRKGYCYLIRKGHSRTDLPLSFDAPVIDFDMTDKEIVRMFNTYKYCFFYDTQTMYASIAAVCGCIPIIIMEPGKTVDDYRKGEEKAHYGIAFGNTPEQIEYAIQTRDKLIQRMRFDERNRNNAMKFINIVENHFGLKL